MFVVADRVRETTTTSGTGTLTLGGAVAMFQAVSAAFANGDIGTFCCAGTSGWETFIGTYNTGTLSRDIVLESSNAGALVNFGGESKDVFCIDPADQVKWPTVSNSIASGDTLNISADRQFIVAKNFTNSGAINNSGEMFIIGG